MTATAPFICILGGLGDEYLGWCGVEHDSAEESKTHMKTLKASGFDGYSTSTVAEVEASRAPAEPEPEGV